MIPTRAYTTGQPIPHRIMTTGGRAQTEPANGGFMRVVMRSQHDEPLDEVGIIDRPRKITQEEQDAADDKARKRAMKNLVSSWQERLQLISVITTFFATTEAAMLVNTKPQTSDDRNNGALNASNASLLGALIMHVYAAVLSFLAAFLLIRLKLKEATREELIAEGIKMVSSPLGGSVHVRDVERDPNDVDGRTGATNAAPEPQMGRGPFSVELPIISTNPHIEQVGPFMSTISSQLLSRIHTLCVSFAAIGFVLAIAGIICYAWALHPRSVSIFTSICLGGAILSMAILFPVRSSTLAT
ncbi:hypothetical protein PAXINDRAFT_11658 [Paxillus involutus ATCC 200175]|uniref:Transmembrane protein n=1 Tax=Paxillus involutus ATCC 200175 TaxID=664439 RepID=A0A0C9TIJ9_PAXIN|nr:hypothetical protein PAXINDRAFT_11658 [Paxillus involutus ATCC 200175]